MNWLGISSARLPSRHRNSKGSLTNCPKFGRVRAQILGVCLRHLRARGLGRVQEQALDLRLQPIAVGPPRDCVKNRTIKSRSGHAHAIVPSDPL